MKSKNIFLKPGQNFRVITNDEPMRANYLLREMYERPMLSQDGGWDTTFKNKGWLGTAWHRVEEILPYWVDKSYNDLNSSDLKFHYEIIELISND